MGRGSSSTVVSAQRRRLERHATTVAAPFGAHQGGWAGLAFIVICSIQDACELLSDVSYFTPADPS